MVEEAAAAPLSGAKGAGLPKGKPGRLVPLKGDEPPLQRIESGIAELDRVTGGGLVPGSAVLIGGDPGIGKSTLLIQAMAALARAGHAAIYISGEEAIAQIRLRAERLGLTRRPGAAGGGDQPVRHPGHPGRRADLPAVTVDRLDPDPVVAGHRIGAGHGVAAQGRRRGADPLCQAEGRAPCCWSAMSPRKARSPARRSSSTWSTPCSISRATAATSSASCGRSRTASARPTRSASSRCPSAGLREVHNPSRSVHRRRARPATPGSAVFAGMEGTRPLLIEVQALVSPSVLGTPRRAVVGWDSEPAGDDAGGARGARRAADRRLTFISMSQAG